MNIASRIQAVARIYPDKKSVVFSKPNKDGTFSYPFYTFDQFETRSNQIAHQLSEFGIKPGMRTLLFVKPSLDFSVITFALFKLGAIPVLIDPGMGLKNLLSSIRQVKPEAMVSEGIVHWIRRIKPSFFQTVKIKVSLTEVFGRTRCLYKKLETKPKQFDVFPAQMSDTSAILFTSGGTGIPKGVVYTHGILHAQTQALQKMFDLTAENRDLPGFPLFALFTLAMGMTSVIPSMDPTKPAQCDPKEMVQNILDNQITFVAGSPAIWERVGKYCLDHQIKLPSVKQVVMFGAPVRSELHEIFQQVLVNGDTFTPYGATECLPVSLISGSEVLGHTASLSRKGAGTCIGLPAPQTTIKIIKTSDIPEASINELPIGEIGEILVEGPQVTPEYFEMPAETAKAKIIHENKIWHRMGDLGYFDTEGRLWFLGRKSHRVEAGNDEIYYPIRLEAIFNQHPEVKRSALIGLKKDGHIFPAIVLERNDHSTDFHEKFLSELKALAHTSQYTQLISDYYLVANFPVDVRHNIKIDRLALAKRFS